LFIAKKKYGYHQYSTAYTEKSSEETYCAPNSNKKQNFNRRHIKKIPNDKSQITNKFQMPTPNDQNDFIGDLEFRPLKFIWYLVLGFWCLSIIHSAGLRWG
jgi:hypothetical protein